MDRIRVYLEQEGIEMKNDEVRYLTFNPLSLRFKTHIDDVELFRVKDSRWIVRGIRLNVEVCPFTNMLVKLSTNDAPPYTISEEEFSLSIMFKDSLFKILRSDDQEQEGGDIGSMYPLLSLENVKRVELSFPQNSSNIVTGMDGNLVSLFDYDPSRESYKTFPFSKGYSYFVADVFREDDNESIKEVCMKLRHDRRLFDLSEINFYRAANKKVAKYIKKYAPLSVLPKKSLKMLYRFNAESKHIVSLDVTFQFKSGDDGKAVLEGFDVVGRQEAESGDVNASFDIKANCSGDEINAHVIAENYPYLISNAFLGSYYYLLDGYDTSADTEKANKKNIKRYAKASLLLTELMYVASEKNPNVLELTAYVDSNGKYKINGHDLSYYSEKLDEYFQLLTDDKRKKYFGDLDSYLTPLF